MLDNIYLEKYRDKMTSIMLKMNPDWDQDIIEEVIDDLIEKNVQDPVVEIDNNYTKEHKSSTLLSVINWIYKREPIISGNGTFYKNQHEAKNPVAKMLEGFLNKRKMHKKQMFAIEDTESPRYKELDLFQGNDKKNANSYYGGSGAPTSAFYSVWSGPATTNSAQQVISTAEQLFEGFVADNYIFLNLTEAIEWIETNLEEFKKDDYTVDSFVKRVSISEVKERILSKILEPEDSDEKILESYLYDLDDEQLSILYYKNNMIRFIEDHEEIQDLILSIYENIENLEYADGDDWLNSVPSEYKDNFIGRKCKDWNKFVNKSYFMNPNDPPESIIPILDELKEYLMKYVFCRYLSFDRVYRLKNFERRVVTVIDTDSNILSLDTVVNYLFDNVIKDSYGRTKEQNGFIVINMLCYMLTSAVTDILLTYGEHSNIPEEFRPIYSMKNEYMKNE